MSPRPKPSRHILIFDDDLYDVRDKLPQPPGVTLHVCDRADDCVSQVQAQSPRFVLMDFHMRSGLKGDDAVTLLREAYGQTLHIVGISSAPSLNHRLQLAGANQTVQKNHVVRLLEELAAIIAIEQEEA